MKPARREQQEPRSHQLDARQAGPALAVTQWINSATNLADLKGKIVVIDFWAYAVPVSIPHSNELQKTPTSVIIIAVCAPKGGEKMAETVKARGIEYAVALDTGDKGSTFAAYKADSYPDYFIIDRGTHWGDVANRDVETASNYYWPRKSRLLLNPAGNTPPSPVSRLRGQSRFPCSRRTGWSGRTCCRCSPKPRQRGAC